MDKPGTSHVSTSEVSSSAASSLSFTGPESIERFKNQTQYQIMQLQRMVQETRNAYSMKKGTLEAIRKELLASTEKAKSIESKLPNLQKIVATQVDHNSKLQREVTDKDKEAKERNNKLNEEVGQLKDTLQRCGQQLLEVGRNSGSASIPANLTQMFEALERQLGMYDVKLAEMDVRFQVLESTNYDGKLLWKIKDFQRRREDAKRGKTLSIYSQPFYTSKYGYKMCLRVYLNGDGMGKNTHISLFFVLMKGDYDALLPFPFRQKVTLMLLDQGPDRRHLSDVFRPDPTSSSFKRPNSDMNIASGCPMFVSHDTVNNSSYLKEDTIFVRVIIETTDLENY